METLADNSESGLHANALNGLVRSSAPRQAGFAQSFAQIVGVLMRDRSFCAVSIGELEWLVLPPLMSGQFVLAHAPVAGEKGAKSKSAGLIPVAVALWARVSSNIDKVLSDTIQPPPKLQASDWTSGNNLWLMALAGDQRMLPKFVRQLRETQFKGQLVKMRQREAGEKTTIVTLDR